MKSLKNMLLLLAAFAFAGTLFTGCDKDQDPDDPTQTEEQFVSLETPYLICANRNPGGVGFDFSYNNEIGGGNNIDSLSVSDFEYDVKIRTIKGEKPDGSLGGAPFFKMHEDVQAVNYSTIDTECTGYTDFQNLTLANIQEYTVTSDADDFNLESLPTGDTGAPVWDNLMSEYGKLVIGFRWKSAANNDVADDEPIWIIKTREGKLVKLIVTDFPADPAPTATGYVSIEWAFVE